MRFDRAARAPGGSGAVPSARWWSPRRRRGMSLIELMVAIAAMLLLVAVLVGGVGNLLEVHLHSASRELVLLYRRLHDEAVLRNLSFRVGFDLEKNEIVIQAGEPGALIFDDPQQRADYEREVQDKLRFMDEEDIAAWRASRKPFEELDETLKETVKMPAGVRIGGVYTPQYGKFMQPIDLGGELEDEYNAKGELIGKQKIYSFVFPNGFTEHTLIWLVEEGDPTEGYTVEIEPLSGRAHIHGELIETVGGYEFAPSEAPGVSQ